MSEHLGVLCIKQLETDLFMEIWNKGDDFEANTGGGGGGLGAQGFQ